MKEVSLKPKTTTSPQNITTTQKTVKQPMLIKAIGIIKSDLVNLIKRKKQTDQEWEDYKRFCELARKK